MGREGHVESVLLPGDLHLTADLVILSVGVRANVGIAKAAGAAVGHGVKVNGRMETSLADVYACGDCAEPEAPTAQLWPVAAEMGRVAGANAAGEAVEYVPASFAVTFHGMDTQLYAEGDVGLNGAEAYRIETVRDEAAQTLDKRYYVHGKLRGAILLGDIHKAKAYSDEMRK